MLAVAALPAAAVPAAFSPAASGRSVIVICSPGSPGNTEEARPTMETFAREVEAAAGLPAGSVEAVYHETEEGGAARLGGGDVALALVPLPFLLSHRELDLSPLLEVSQAAGTDEVWSLVARKGALTTPAALDGWEIAGTSGYAPAFVRGPVLAAWGRPPASARIVFTSRPLSALRRAASGEKVAVVLDAAQTSALSSLPFGDDLEIVARSKPLPAILLCAVGSRQDPAAREAIVKGLLGIHGRASAAVILETMRIVRFLPAAAERIEEARRAYEDAIGSSP